MAEEVISTNEPKSGRSLDVAYDFGSNLDEAVERFGAEVVFTNFKRQGVISLQGIVRNGLKGDVKDEEILNRVDSWKPGVVQRSGKSKTEKITDLFGKMDDDAKLALLQQLKSQLEA